MEKRGTWIRTKEHNKKNSERRKLFYMNGGVSSFKGRKLSIKQKLNISNTIKRFWQIPEYRENMVKKHIGKKQTDECIAKRVIHLIGRKKSPEEIKKLSIANTGKIHSAEQNRKNGDARRGEKSHFWKGGITPINKILRASLNYHQWRLAVLKRDNFICQYCKIRGGKLHADHIKMFAFYPKLRFDINNGQTLCKSCHDWKSEWDMKIFTGKVPKLNIV